MEKKFIRVRTLKDITIFTSILIIGFILVVITKTEADNIGGYTLITIGLMLACFLKTGYMDIETQEKYFKKNFSFLGDMKTQIISALASSPESIDMSQEGNGQVLKLSVYQGRHICNFLYMYHICMCLVQKCMNMKSVRLKIS